MSPDSIFKCPYYTDKEPVSIRIESWLYGGMGIAYLEAVSGEGLYLPVAIEKVQGNVQDAHNILVNDLRFCYLGDTDMEALFQMPELTQRKHILKIVLNRHF